MHLAVRVRQLVNGQRLWSRERPAAHLALVGLLTRMYQHVVLQVHLLGELLVAFRTGERLHTGMNKQVSLQITLLCKCLTTSGALKRSLARVGSRVHL